METDLFSNTDIDWDSAIVGAFEDLAQQFSVVEADETLREDWLARVENLFANAEGMSQFNRMQELAARLGDLCCGSPFLEVLAQTSSSGWMRDVLMEHDDCDDEHDTHDTPHKDKPTARKKAKSTTTKEKRKISLSSLLGGASIAGAQ